MKNSECDVNMYTVNKKGSVKIAELYRISRMLVWRNISQDGRKKVLPIQNPDSIKEYFITIEARIFFPDSSSFF